MKLNILKGKIREKESNYDKCSKAIGITSTSFSNKMNKKSNFSVEEARLLSKHLELTGEEMLNIFLT